MGHKLRNVRTFRYSEYVIYSKQNINIKDVVGWKVITQDLIFFSFSSHLFMSVYETITSH